MKYLMEELKSGTFKNVYLFFGEERYLTRLYEKRLREKLMESGQAAMNVTEFEGKAIDLDDVDNALNTLPFMSTRRLVALQNTGLFAAGKKIDSERCAEIVANAPDTAVLLFIETEVDKRLKLYKQVVKTGRAVEFVTPKEKELVDWVCRSFAQRGKIISPGDAVWLLRTVANDMGVIENEIEKVICYLGGRDAATREDIDAVCTKSLDSGIFDMVDAIGNKNPEKALDIFSGLLLRKESPIMVVTMIARQLRVILLSKLWAERGLHTKEIAERTGQRSFVISACLNQGRNFSKESLMSAIEDCLTTDVNIKTGRMNDRLAVETLIISCSQNI